jgi:ribosome-binding factor A
VSTHSRPERVAQMVQQCLGELFARGIRDPRVGLVTITGAKVSADLRQARVYWTVHGGGPQQKSTAEGLEAAKSFLRHEVGKTLGMRVVPNLTFTYDEAIDRGDRVDQLLREAKASDLRLAAESPAEQLPPSEAQDAPKSKAQSPKPPAGEPA